MSNSIYKQQAAQQNPAKAVTPQSKPIPGREAEMKQNNAGGFVFTIDQWSLLDRFLMLGTEKNTYYTSAKADTEASFANLRKCIAEDGARVVARICEYSEAGRAPKNDPAVVALAVCAAVGNAEVQALAYAALPAVARTGTWLFLFVSILNDLGKWNGAAKRGIANWYNARTLQSLTNQLMKYQQRDGWSHRDVLRLGHVKPTDEVVSNLFKYVVKKEYSAEDLPATVQLIEKLKRPDVTVKEVIDAFAQDRNLTWEMIPTQFLSNPAVLEAMLPNQGMTALIRRLGLYSRAGLDAPLTDTRKLIISKLTDADAIKAGRVHPVTILQAYKQYTLGRGLKGDAVWAPQQEVKDALQTALYTSFNTFEIPKGRYYIGVDCSGSMFGAMCQGASNLNAAEAAAVMALLIAKQQDEYFIGGFAGTMGQLDITPSMTLDKVLSTMRRFNWGGTDCALPMRDAAKRGMRNIDRFVVITDNETWAGHIAPSQALRDYRAKYGPGAKLAVVGTSVSEFSIADPKDSGMMDIAGFDSNAAALIANF